jgi:hypothetical protein
VNNTAVPPTVVIHIVLVDYNKMIAGTEGAVECILAAMKHFPEDPDLQLIACKTLQNLVYGGKKIDVVVATSSAFASF